MTIKRERRAQQKMQRISLPCTGEYKIAHIGVWPGGRVGSGLFLVGRVGRPLTSGCRAYVCRVVPLKKVAPTPREGWSRHFAADVVGILARRRWAGSTCSAPVGRRALDGGAGECWVHEGIRQAPGDGRSGHPPPHSVPWWFRSDETRSEKTRSEAET